MQQHQQQTMVERIARSLSCQGIGVAQDRRNDPDPDWSAYVETARRLLDDMRLPTDAMVSFAAARDGSGSPYPASMARHTWHVMIDAALGETAG